VAGKQRAIALAGNVRAERNKMGREGVCAWPHAEAASARHGWLAFHMRVRSERAKGALAH